MLKCFKPLAFRQHKGSDYRARARPFRLVSSSVLDFTVIFIIDIVEPNGTKSPILKGYFESHFHNVY
ncbi:MAG: hypothetical protein BGO39_19285 [Chloroflexi bacterium 54-19]|nr:MAG: hypothetical protein BGO39_19285 [Chloroflexi bacterium 54-19]